MQDYQKTFGNERCRVHLSLWTVFNVPDTQGKQRGGEGMNIADFIQEKDKKEFCENCYDCACTRHCVIWRKAEIAYDQNEREQKGVKYE